MILNLISLSTVKSQLGITASTYDSALTALIPIVSDDVRRILNNRYDKYYAATITAGLASMTWASLCPMKLGTVVYSPALPADTYVKEYDPVTGVHTLSATATASATYIYPTITIAQWPTISKMIWYRYKSQNVNSVDIKGVSSESYGPVSVSYSEKEINKKYNYPQVLIDDLGTPYARTC